MVRAWNTCSTQVRGWPKNQLIVPPDGRSKGPVWEDFPETLRAEVDMLFETVRRRRKLANGTRARAWTDKTIRTRRRELIAYAGKAVSVGCPIDSLTSLSILSSSKNHQCLLGCEWAGTEDLHARSAMAHIGLG
jgi:hypothetical protein